MLVTRRGCGIVLYTDISHSDDPNSRVQTSEPKTKPTKRYYQREKNRETEKFFKSSGPQFFQIDHFVIKWYSGTSGTLMADRS